MHPTPDIASSAVEVASADEDAKRSHMLVKGESFTETSGLIRKRCMLGYGLNINVNLALLSKRGDLFNDMLDAAWKHIDYIRRLIKSNPDIKPSETLHPYLGGVFGLLTAIRMKDTDPDLVKLNNVVGTKLFANNSARREAVLILSLLGDDEEGVTTLSDLEAAFLRLIDSTLEKNDFGEAAAMCMLLLGNMDRALQFLYESESERYLFIATIVAGHLAAPQDLSATSAILLKWQQLCAQMVETAPSIYLKFFYSFIANGFQLRPVLFELQELPLKLRLAAALRVLSVDDLILLLKQSLRTAVENFSLCDGLVLGGLSPISIEVFSSYVDRTGDVQTPALLTSLISNRYFSETLVELWHETYKDLLNRWRLFHLRCAYDMSRQKCYLYDFVCWLDWPDGKRITDLLDAQILEHEFQRQVCKLLLPMVGKPTLPPTQSDASSQVCSGRRSFGTSQRPSFFAPPASLPVSFPPTIKRQEDWREYRSIVRCQYCGNGVSQSSVYRGGANGGATDSMRKTRFSATGTNPTGGNQANHAKFKTQSHQCPFCKKSLPQCSICSLAWGSPVISNALPTSAAYKQYHFFAWCSKCFHGGHLSHLTKWFEHRSVCPVAGCNCNCRAS